VNRYRSYDDTPLRIAADVHAAMIEHCRREAPLECCGLLAGIPPRASVIYPLQNVAPEGAVRYDADPLQLLDAHRDLRERGLELLAIYHSHPRWRPVPSRADLELNYYGTVPRIIVSLLGPEPEVRTWRLFPNAYQELPWRVVPVVPGNLSD
jgi:proteasome lid subunit RPN8/RPN11